MQEKTNIFHELYSYLDEKGIKDVEKWKKIRGKRKKKINLYAAEWYRNKLPFLVDLIESSEGIVLNFEKFTPKWNNTQKVAKKAVFYSDISVILINNEFKVEKEREYSYSTKKQERKSDNRVRSGTIQDLIKVLLQIKPLVIKGIVIPLPINLNFDDLVRDELKIFQEYKKLTQKIKNYQLDTFSIPVSLDKWKIRRQIEEIQEFKPTLTGLKPIQICLPYLTNLKLDTLIGLREDNYDYFQKYQQALREFLLTTPNIKSESAFFEIMKKVNCEIEVLTDRVEGISKSRNRKGAEVILGTGLSLMTILVDAQIATYIGGLVGGKTLLDNLDYFYLSKSKLKTNDYHMAYLTHKESLNKI